MEGVVHGEDQHALAEAPGTPSGPGQQPNLSASSFGDADVFLEEFINFDQDATEEPIDQGGREDVPDAAGSKGLRKTQIHTTKAPSIQSSQ